MHMHDLVIANGTVVDGTGGAGRRADVAITDGVITQVGDLNGARSQRVIDAEGHIVSPGFIDVHTHMDAQIAWDPLGECSCFHGVTTAVMGNCGFTLAPVNSDARELVVRNLERAEDISAEAMAAGIDWSWETYPQYLDFVDATPKGINYAGYVGHSALRTWAMGERAFEEAANADDIAMMAAQVQASMRAGAIGFTTSVSGNHETSDDRPVASRFASRQEINALVESMAALGPGGIFELAQHPDMRSSDPDKREDYARWLIDLAVSTGVPLTYGMLAFGTKDHQWKPVVELLDRVKAEGGMAWGQAHSRHFGAILSFQTQLPFDRLPVWRDNRSQSLDDQRRALRDPDILAKLIDVADNAEYGRAIGTEARKPQWNYVFQVTSGLPPYETIADIAAAKGASPTATFLDIAIESDLNTFFMQAAANHDQDRVLDFLRHPQAIPTFSDSGAHVSQIMDSSLQTHMLGHWVRNQGAFSVEEAVHMMTQRTATAWGFADRGVIAEGMAADINVFDIDTVTPDMPELVYDLPGGARRLRQTATGFLAILVNGQVLLDSGQPTGARPGQLLRGPLAE